MNCASAFAPINPTVGFEGYKGPGSFLFQGYASSKEAIEFIEETHLDWRKSKQSGYLQRRQLSQY
jgi:hypothetical protein